MAALQRVGAMIERSLSRWAELAFDLARAHWVRA